MGQKLAIGNTGEGTLFLAALIIVAQVVMIPMSILVGRRADRWGRKAIFLAAFVALPLRGVLFTLSNNAGYLISVQVLDGVAAGIFGALFPLVIADLTRGTGRYNVTFGVASTMQGIGASLSTTVAGVIIVIGAYDRAFLVLAGIAFLALLIFFSRCRKPLRPRNPAGGRRHGGARAPPRRVARLSPSPRVHRCDDQPPGGGGGGAGWPGGGGAGAPGGGAGCPGANGVAAPPGARGASRRPWCPRCGRQAAVSGCPGVAED